MLAVVDSNASAAISLAGLIKIKHLSTSLSLSLRSVFVPFFVFPNAFFPVSACSLLARDESFIINQFVLSHWQLSHCLTLSNSRTLRLSDCLSIHKKKIKKKWKKESVNCRWFCCRFWPCFGPSKMVAWHSIRFEYETKIQREGAERGGGIINHRGYRFNKLHTERWQWRWRYLKHIFATYQKFSAHQFQIYIYGNSVIKTQEKNLLEPLVNLMNRCEKPAEVFGDFNGAPPHSNSSRCLVKVSPRCQIKSQLWKELSRFMDDSRFICSSNLNKKLRLWVKISGH